MAMRYCGKCKKTMVDTNFYTYKNKEKCEICKACLTMHINNWEPDTFVWILEKFDVPYVPEEWNVLRDRAYQKDPYKMTGLSVIGKYLSKMRIKPWNQYSWSDTEMLQKRAAKRARENGLSEVQEAFNNVKEAYENGEITEQQFKTYQGVTGPTITYGAETAPGPHQPTPGQIYPANAHPYTEVALPDLTNDLSADDKVYLALKWGQLYTASEWITLEKLYSEYDKSFDLHNADLLTGIIQVCKLDLKSNQALDTGDIDSYSKLARASDALRKSLKLTEAQRKEEKGSQLNALGVIVSYVEKKTGYIPKIDTSVDRDIADKDLRNIKDYNWQLIKDDPAVYKQIENYIKKRDILHQQEEDEANGVEEITDEDLKDYKEFVESQQQEDKEMKEFEFTDNT